MTMVKSESVMTAKFFLVRASFSCTMTGIDVTMVRRAPLRDPVIFRVGDYEIALRAAQARSIHVDLHPDLQPDLQPGGAN